MPLKDMRIRQCFQVLRGKKRKQKHIRPTMLLSNQEYKTQSGFNYVCCNWKADNYTISTTYIFTFPVLMAKNANVYMSFIWFLLLFSKKRRNLGIAYLSSHKCKTNNVRNKKIALLRLPPKINHFFPIPLMVTNYKDIWEI